MSRTSQATRLPRVVAGVVLLALVACQPATDTVPAVTDDMDCPQVAEVVDQALRRGQRFIAGEESDALLAADLIFALSGAEERPECVDDATRSRAAGMRATLSGVGG